MGALRTYSPRLVLDWVRDEPERAHRRVDGTLAFVDISGFTALTERLASRGRVGAEEMSDALNDVFGALLPVAYAMGAQLIKYGGDAVLLLFTGERHPERACAAACDMQQTIRRAGLLHTSVGQVRLRMSIGIHSGAIDFYLVGSRHRELVVTGPAATMTAAMEKTAEAGEIVVSDATAEQLPASCRGGRRGGGRLVARRPRVAAVGPQVAGTDDDEAAARVLSPPLATYLANGQRVSEHRAVVPAFLEISGVDAMTADAGPDAVAAALHEVVTVVQRACERYQVTLLASDISADGTKLILVGGAPLAGGHDEQRVLCVLREVIDSRPTLPLRAGVSYGRAFAGDFGTDVRRTWSVIGDVVNLAARLMSRAAAGEIVGHAPLLASCQLPFELEELEPFLVKGKADPVRAYAVGPLAERGGLLPAGGRETLVGRAEELGSLAEWLADAVAGRGGAVVLTGDAGLGKSRLVAELRRSVTGVDWYVAGCDVYSHARAYAAVGQLLRAALGISPRSAASSTLRRLDDVVTRHASQLACWLPLLARALELEVEDTPQTRDLDPQRQAARLASVTVELLRAHCRKPAVFLVDDAHLVDPASRDVLAQLATAAAELPWLVVLVTRDPATVPVPAARQLPLAGLADDAVELVVAEATADAPLLPHVVADIVRRSQGNPMFAVELARARRGSDDDATLPESLEGALAQRLDGLPPGARQVARVAAVLGQTFPRELLVECLGSREPLDGAWPQLRELLAENARGELSFRSGMLRDAAYVSLPYRMRRELHARVVRALGSRPGAPADVLATHAFVAGDYCTAFAHAGDAGAQALRRYAFAEAAELYRVAATSARRCTTASDDDLVTTLERLGDCSFQLGDCDAAAAAYADARRHCCEPIRRALLAGRLARVELRAGRLARAARWSTVAIREAATLETMDPVDVAAIHTTRAFVLRGQGRSRAALLVAQRALAALPAEPVSITHAELHHVIDWAQVELAEEESGHAQAALAVYEQLGDLNGQVSLHNHLGVRAYFRGDWDVAAREYIAAGELCRRCGHDWGAAMTTYNLSEVLLDQCRLDDAVRSARSALAVWQASGSADAVRMAQLVLAAALARQGRYDAAQELLDEVRVTAGSDADRSALIDVDIRQAELHVLRGDGAAALTLLPALRRRVDRDELRQSLPGVLRLTALARAQCGEVEQALCDAEESRVVAAARGASHDVAFAAHASVLIQASRFGRADPDLTALRDELFARLGVVGTPAVPLPVTLPEQAGQIARV